MEREYADPAVTAALEATGVPYEVLECDPDFADTAAFCERYGVPPERSANTIVVASKAEPRRFAACIVLASQRLDVNKSVRRLMGVKKLSFATADETAALTGMAIGGVTPFALPADLTLYVDRAVMAPDWVIVGGGNRSSKIKVAPEVFTRLPGDVVVDDIAL